MNEIDILVKQTQDAYHWTNKIISAIPTEKWDHTPENLETNIAWQVGHLVISYYFHSIMVIAGHQMDIIQQVPLKEYDRLFTNAPAKDAAGKIKPDKLKEHLRITEKKSIEIIKALSPENLESSLVPGAPHPIAKNKFEALDWNIKHTMWHCGQLGILKRITGERLDFGLKRS
jgi:hypothetical protein